MFEPALARDGAARILSISQRGLAVVEKTVRHSTIIEAIYSWRSARRDGATGDVAAMRMHPRTALALEASALEYPYAAANRTADGMLRVWGLPVHGDESLSPGVFELIPHKEP